MPCIDHDVIKWAGDALIAGDFEPLLQRYAETVAVFTPDNVYRLQGREQVRAALADHRQGLLRAGCVGMRAEIAAIGLPRGKKYRNFVTWTYDMGQGQPKRHACATYFCVKGPGGARVEMIEYREVGFENSRDWHAGRALIRPQTTLATQAA